MSHGNCDDALHQLYHFLDGELTPERRADIQQHLEDCPPCYEAFDFEAEIRDFVAKKCCDKVPESLKAKIADAIGQNPPPTSSDPEI